MSEPVFVPDPTPDPSAAWPAALPRPTAATRGELATFTTRFAPDFRHGPWSMAEAQRRPTSELAWLASARPTRRKADANGASGLLPVVEWTRALFVDLEKGSHPRGGECVSLAGVGRFEADEAGADVDGRRSFVVRQFAARSADGEVALLDAVATLAAQADLLVTFSGRSFDAPFLTSRATSQRVELELPPRHFDLFRMASRVMRGRFVDETLATLERTLLRFERGEVAAGAAPPRAWSSLFEPGGEPLLNAVLAHNLFDVVALPALAAELSFRLESPQDAYEREHVADARARHGHDRASLERALEDDPDSFRALLEMSKVLERDEGDLGGALANARRALENAPAHAADAARRRIAQLERRMRRAGAMDEEDA
jgi:hypothetical protein